MNESMAAKLESLGERLEELNAMLADPALIGDHRRFTALSREHAEINPVVQCFRRYRSVEEEMEVARQFSREADAELRELAMEELHSGAQRLGLLVHDLEKLLLPKDPNDEKNVFLEIRAGTGGDEAGLFAADLHRMYLRFAEQNKWQVEVFSSTVAELGGYKEVVLRISGERVYSRLKFESGGHRVQRVPATESQGRIHTSACTVAVLPEVEEIEEVPIDSGDLRIDTYRASGAGGQHVNKTDSAIRITHLPSGLVVECQDERSQHKNRSRAMSLLRSRLLQREQDRQAREQAQTRRDLIGSGDRSQRIRTYNYPQSRVTDHRINLTLYKLDDILNGALDLLIAPLTQEQEADLLLALHG